MAISISMTIGKGIKKGSPPFSKEREVIPKTVSSVNL